MRKKASDEEELQYNDDVAPDQPKQTDDVKDELSKIDEEVVAPAEPVKRRRLRLPTNHKKRWLILVAAIVVILIVIGVVPYTRYKILGLFIKEKYTLTVMDSVTKTPVTGAMIQIGDTNATTDVHGQASVTLPVGDETVSITKQYYKSITSTAQIRLTASQNVMNLSMIATGRQVPVVVVNKINGQPVADVTIKVLDTTAETDGNGKAIIVLPTNAATQQGTISGNGYNSVTVPITVTADIVPANTLAIVPTGHVYFLSNLSGKIDVVSTNLDGTNRTTVLAGTGNESAPTTALLASRDWKYLALQSTRDSSTTSKIYLITTATNAVTTMDEGTNVNFQFIGWSGDNFVYTVNRQNVLLNSTYPQTALKAFNAATGHITTIDQTDAQSGGYGVTFTSSLQTTILSDGILYSKFWDRTGYYASTSQLAGKTQVIVKTKPDGTGAQTVKSYDATTYQSYQQQPGTPSEVYFRLGGQDGVGNQRAWEYYKYENGTIQSTTEVNNNNFFSNTYPVYLVSPSASATFWSVPTDGKYNLFVGDQNGDKGTGIATLSDYNTYGWYSDDYLLVSKGGSELYIMPKKGGTALKIADYYKPSQYFGYGGGYGGI